MDARMGRASSPSQLSVDRWACLWPVSLQVRGSSGADTENRDLVRARGWSLSFESPTYRHAGDKHFSELRLRKDHRTGSCSTTVFVSDPEG